MYCSKLSFSDEGDHSIIETLQQKFWAILNSACPNMKLVQLQTMTLKLYTTLVLLSLSQFRLRLSLHRINRSWSYHCRNGPWAHEHVPLGETQDHNPSSPRLWPAGCGSGYPSQLHARLLRQTHQDWESEFLSQQNGWLKLGCWLKCWTADWKFQGSGLKVSGFMPTHNRGSVLSPTNKLE